MKPVLGLVEDDGLRAVHHLVGDFLAAMGRQAMHEDRVLRGGAHELRIHLIWRENGAAEVFVGVAHGHPAVGDDRLRARDRGVRVAGDVHRRAILRRPVDQALRRRKLGRRRDIDREAETRGGVNPARQHIVAVADPGDRAPANVAQTLLEGEEIRHDLAGMREFGEAVDDGHRGVARQLGQIVVRENADHDGVDEARQHARRVGDALASSDLHLIAREHDRLAAQIAHGEIEGDAGAGRGLVEDERQIFAGERTRRRLDALHAPRFQRFGEIEDVAQLRAREIGEIEKMTRPRHGMRGHYAAPNFCPAGADRRAQARSRRVTASEI